MGGGLRSLVLRVGDTWAMSSKVKGLQHPLMRDTVSIVSRSSFLLAHKWHILLSPFLVFHFKG